MASHKWGVPLSACPKCGEKASVCFSYPTIDLKALGVAPSSDFDLSDFEVSWDEFVRRRDRILDKLDEPRDIYPGTSFGPLKGKVVDDYGPIIQGFSNSLELREDALHVLDDGGFLDGIARCQAELRGKRYRDKVWSVELPPLAQLELAEDQSVCEVCLQFTGEANPMRLKADSIPDGVHLFTVKNSRYADKIASAEFVECVLRMGWTDLPEFSPVEQV